MQLRRLVVRGYRRLEELEWEPGPGLNCLIGPGDVGKSSILDAVGLVLHPAPIGVATEYDYHRRRVEHGFEIEVVVGQLSDVILGTFQPPLLYGWRTDAADLVSAPEEGTEPVLLIRARGTPELEIQHHIIAPNGEERPLPVRARQELGLSATGGSRPAYREFRLSRGSLLERIVGREEMRARAIEVLKAANAGLELPDEAGKELQRLRDRLDEEGIAPGDLSLALLSPPGQNLLGLLALAAGDGSEAIPLGFYGQGTQRIAAFLLALELSKVSPIVTLDEAELGLEPYRQRQLVTWLRQVIADHGQAFVTTHSPVVLAELAIGEVHRVGYDDTARQAIVTRLEPGLESVLRFDPEAVLSRMPVIAEGATEAGLLDVLLGHQGKNSGKSLYGLGIHVVEGSGQPDAISLGDAFSHAGFRVAGFFDEQPEHSGRRQRLSQSGAVLGGLGYASAEEAIIATLPLDALDRLLDLRLPGGVDRNGRLQQLTEALGEQARPSFNDLIQRAGGEMELRNVMTRVALDRGWFKARSAARQLAEFLVAEGVPEELDGALQSFWERILAAVSGLGIDAPGVSDDTPG